ncbi:hypothetical protein BGW80DRAFT_1335642 [Lactifluus volemus]|nr:hypothetical protein BGW80DRAFT_1335642 [Lactifluus volemus]
MLFLTALLVPLAASAVPTNGDANGPKRLNQNLKALIATSSQDVPPIASGPVSDLPTQTSSIAEAYRLPASHSSGENTVPWRTVVTRQIPTNGVNPNLDPITFPCICNFPSSDTTCGRFCSFECNFLPNGQTQAECLTNCCLDLQV